MKLGFIICSYNSSVETIKCIDSIQKIQNLFDPIIIIVDDNSNTENLEILNTIKLSTRIIIIRNTINIGYFKSLNRGIQYLHSNSIKVEFLIIGNNDLIFLPDFANKIRSKKNMLSKYSVVSPNIITENGEYQNPHVITKISWIRKVIYEIYYSNYLFSKIIIWFTNHFKPLIKRSDTKQHEFPQKIFMGFGACYILTNEFFKFNTLLYSPNFLMHEEYFLSYQISKFNSNIFYEPSIRLIHSNNKSIGNLPSKFIWEESKKSYQILKKHLPEYRKFKDYD